MEKLGKAWDEDPRIFAVLMGLIGYWGEHHNPAPTVGQRRLLTEAFQQAFKPVLVRHTNAEFVEGGFGIYYDTFATISREPPGGPKDQFPWQAAHVYPDIWKRAPIEGEVEYNWQQQRESAKPEETFGRTPDERMTVPAYRRYHASYLGWINNYDCNREVLAGATELQQVHRSQAARTTPGGDRQRHPRRVDCQLLKVWSSCDTLPAGTSREPWPPDIPCDVVATSSCMDQPKPRSVQQARHKGIHFAFGAASAPPRPAS